MKQPSSNSCISNNSNPRCHFVTPSGRRCRLQASGSGAQFCFRHTQLQQSAIDSDDLSVLFAEITEFNSATQINDFLTKLSSLLVQNRISTRRAAVLAYIQNLLLRTLPAIQLESGDQSGSCQIDLTGMPRPIHPSSVNSPLVTHHSPLLSVKCESPTSVIDSEGAIR